LPTCEYSAPSSAFEPSQFRSSPERASFLLDGFCLTKNCGTRFNLFESNPYVARYEVDRNRNLGEFVDLKTRTEAVVMIFFGGLSLPSVVLKKIVTALLLSAYAREIVIIAEGIETRHLHPATFPPAHVHSACTAFAAGAQLTAHTQPALRTGLMAPAWRLLHVSRRLILDLT